MLIMPLALVQKRNIIICDFASKHGEGERDQQTGVAVAARGEAHAISPLLADRARIRASAASSTHVLHTQMTGQFTTYPLYTEMLAPISTAEAMSGT